MANKKATSNSGGLRGQMGRSGGSKSGGIKSTSMGRRPPTSPKAPTGGKGGGKGIRVR